MTQVALGTILALMKLRKADGVYCMGAVGAGLLLCGMVWVGVFHHYLRSLPEPIKYEVRLPWTPRLMVLLGLWLLVIVAVRIGISYLQRRRKGDAPAGN